jgi:hypothetical protein
MNLPEAGGPLCTYVELGPAAQPARKGDAAVLLPPDPGTEAALLRDYLGILVFHFGRPGADVSAAGISAAFANLPGLLLRENAAAQTMTLVGNHVSGERGDLAVELAKAWSRVSDWAVLLPVTQAMVGCLCDADGSALVAGRTQTAIVLWRPLSASPALGYCTVNLVADPGDPDAFGEPIGPRWKANWLHAYYFANSSALTSSLQFAAQIQVQGLSTHVAGVCGYRAVPLG